MSGLLHFSDSRWRGVGATIQLDSGEPCLLSLAQTGVLVKKSRWGIFGPTLYNEKNIHLAAKTALALQLLFPEVLFPKTSKNPVLVAFANAIWHCANCSMVAHVLNEAIPLSERQNEIDDERVERVRPFVSKVVPAYGEIMEKWPLVVFPTSKLPLPKEEMKIALQLAWGMTTDSRLRDFVEIAYVHLCHFRDDIAAPIDPALPKGAAPHEVDKILTPFIAISKQMTDEQAKLTEEFAEFKKMSA